MADTFTFTIKPIADLSDIKANVGEIQKAFKSLRLPDKISGNLDKNITNILKEFDKYETKVKEGIKTSGDYRQVESSLNKINNLYQDIAKDVQDIAKIDLSDAFDLNSGDFKIVSDQIKEIVRQLNDVKVDSSQITEPINQLKKAIKNEKISGESGILNQLIGHIDKGEIENAKKSLADLEKYINRVAVKKDSKGTIIGSTVGKLSSENTDAAKAALAEIQQVFAEAQAKGVPLEQTLATLRQRMNELQRESADALDEFAIDVKKSEQETESLVGALQKAHKEDFNFDNQVKSIDRQIQSYFGLGQMIRKVSNIAREAFKSIQELDAAMTETAVVTNFSVSDMWEKLPIYTAQANALGSTIKDVYEATTLYYQQGLNTTQAMGLANETLKMARIAGMDAKEATDAMTAALRGFNLELNQTSAQRINDVYSELAAITASDTQEISTAMEKVASLAHSAGMEVETTSAFLAQMIETTREAPENLGTALKTVVARFQEMKQDPTKLIDSEGVMLDANKVDKALKSIGVNLLNTNGEFRKLDDVFLEIASKWDTMSMGQQRYIATMAAGSRQQSRFIAMMSNYSRTMELVDAAYDANGASQMQFEKTLDSLEAKINKLKNAWNQFAMGLMNNELLKAGVDILTKAIEGVNKFIDVIGKIAPDPFEGVTKSLTTLLLTIGGLTAARKLLSKGIESGVGWFKGEMSGKDAIKNLFSQQRTKATANETGHRDGRSYREGFQAEISELRNDIEEVIKGPTTPIKGKIHFDYDIDEDNPYQFSDEQKSQMAEAEEQLNDSFYPEPRLNKLQQTTMKVGSAFISAGEAVKGFGHALQGTPLQPFGNLCIKVGTALSGLGKTLTLVATGQEILNAKTKEFLVTMAPYALLIGALVGMFKLAYDAYNANNKVLAKSQNTANAASEAYDSLKQSISELNNSIEEFQNSNNALDGLVAGTAAFNEQLAESNAQAAELIEKYDILSNEGYVTTGKNGEIEISDAGFEAVRKQQDELLQQASALSIIEANRANNLQKQTDFYGTAIEDDYLDYANQSEKAKRLEAQLKANSEIAYENAIKTLLNSQDLQNTATAQILAKNLTEYENNVNEAVSKKVKREAYAEFYGYKLKGSDFYDKDGNQIEVDDEAVLESYKTIEAFNQITIDASGLDKALSSADKKFSSILGKQFENSESVFADIMSGNIEADTDALKEIAKTPELLEKLADSLSAEELANILSIDPKEITSETRAKYNQMFVDTLKESTANVLEAQGQIYADLGTRYGQAGQRSGKLKGKTTASNNAAIHQMVNNIDQLSARQANSISTITAKLDERLGVAAADNFLNQAVDLYNRQNEQITTELDTLLQNSSWDSALDRLLTYEKLMNANSSDIRDLGKSMKDAAAETNVLGDAFLEVYSSEDFGEILKDLDKFKNSAGQIDATGVEEMRKESASLDKLLSLNAVSAGAFAKLLEGFNATGIQVVNESMLALLDSTTQVDNVIQKTHEAISNFDPGIDMGEGEDFVKENYEKIKAFYENGEFGNEELINRIKFVVDDTTWQEVYEEYNGNLEQIEARFMPLLETFKDGIKESWGDLANGVDAYGNQITDNTIKVSWADNGGIDLDTTGHTTPEVVEWLQKVYGVSEKMANAMLTDYLNYSPDARYNLNNADWVASLQDKFIPDHLVDNLSNTVVMTTDELQLLSTSLNKGEDEIRHSLADLGYELETFDTSNFTLDSFAKQFGKENRFEWLKGDQEGLLDISSAITDMQSKGIDVTKAQEALYQGIKDQETVFYNGRELELKNIKSAEDLATKMAEMDTEEPWYNAADTFLGRLLEGLGDWIGNNNTSNKNSSSNTSVYGDGTARGASQDIPVGIKASAEWGPARNTIKEGVKEANNEEINIPAKANTEKLTAAIAKSVLEGNNQLITIPVIGNFTSLYNGARLAAATVGNWIRNALNPSNKDANGQNNYISSSGYYMGSTARGSKYGKVGPKGKGGLTLTGEKGYEIAWLPDESRSMILGAHGPQLVNLPSDAVVYTHEQSKKIVKQKSIPAGSHAKPKKGESAYTIQIKAYSSIGKTVTSSIAKTAGTIAKTATSTVSNAYKGWSGNSGSSGSYGGSGGSGSSGGSGGGSGSGSSEKEKDPKRTNWYKEEITRYNLNQSINQIAQQIEKTTKSIEKSLDKLGTKYSDIAKDVDTQAKLINQNISNQKTLQKSYQDQINLLTNGGRSLWIDITDSAGDSSQKSISTSQFISRQSDGSYYVNRDKVMNYAAGLGGDYELQKVNAESIFNTIQSELSNLTSGLLNATKAIQDGEDELQNLLRQVADAFYAWENELTKVYELTQLIEVADGRRGRLAAETSLLLAQVSAGYSGVSDAAERLRQIQRDDAVLIKEQIDLRQKEIEERRNELGLIASSADEWKHYQEIVSANSSKAKTGSLTTGDQAKEQAAWDKYIAAALAESYVKQTYNQDGTINLKLNTAKLEEDRLAGNITEKTYEAIKEGYDKMVEAEEALNESVTSGFELLTDLYKQFNGHIKTMADLENDLIKAFEDTARMEVSKLEALNSSLTTAAKAVLDQVKRNLDARRKAEDNAKTESDIAKKQQRLNTLRANTGGGNAVEIAQLEKEIGDSQKSYGRTLEDQMLSQMQTQADEASKQRQEQIDLAKQQIEYNKQAGVYAEMADYLLADIDDEQDKIQATLLSTQELGRGRWQQLIDELEIKNQVAEAINASEGLIQLADILGIEIDEKTGEIKGGLESIAKALSEKLTEYNQNMMKVNEKASGDRLAQNDQGITSINTKQPSITQNAAPKTSSSSSSSKSSSTPKAKDYSSGWLATLPETNSNYFSAAQIQTLQHGLNTMKWSGLISFGADLAIDGIIGPKTTTAIKALQKLVGTTQDGIWGPQTGSATHKKYPKYAHGGLANKTGPAWLDGTPTKPELVLNAQDTKNFIALKDILSGVMRSISHTDTSNIYNSPTNFEINVNVDKISSDYDVDKLTERIKRNIVKDATYRNVTAVRNFR